MRKFSSIKDKTPKLWKNEEGQVAYDGPMILYVLLLLLIVGNLTMIIRGQFPVVLSNDLITKQQAYEWFGGSLLFFVMKIFGR